MALRLLLRLSTIVSFPEVVIMMNNMDTARWAVTEIRKKMESLETYMDMLSGVMGVLEDRLESVQQEFVGFADAVEDLRYEVQDLPQTLGVTDC